MIIGYFSLQYMKFDDFSEFQNAISNNQTLPPPLESVNMTYCVRNRYVLHPKKKLTKVTERRGKTDFQYESTK